MKKIIDLQPLEIWWEGDKKENVKEVKYAKEN